MARKPLRISELNKSIMEIQESIYGFAITETRQLQQKYPSIIIEGGSRRGQIRTYKEYINIIKTRAPKTAQSVAKLPTYEEYYSEVESLKEEIKDRSTLSKEEKAQREYMLDYLNDNVYDGEYSDFENLTTEELLQAFRNAEEAQREAGYKGTEDSGRWFEDLANEIARILNSKR